MTLNPPVFIFAPSVARRTLVLGITEADKPSHVKLIFEFTFPRIVLSAVCPFLKVVKMNGASVLAEGRRDLVIGYHKSSKPMKPSCSIV